MSVDVFEPARQITQAFTRSIRSSTQIVNPVDTIPQVDETLSNVQKIDQAAFDNAEGKRKVGEIDSAEPVEPYDEPLLKKAKTVNIGESSSKAVEEENEKIEALNFDDNRYNEVLKDEDVETMF